MSDLGFNVYSGDIIDQYIHEVSLALSENLENRLKEIMLPIVEQKDFDIEDIEV